MVNLIVVAAYLAGVMALGLYLSRYVRRDEDYFLAGRSLNQWVIAGTVMATNVAAIYLVGPAGAAYAGAGFSVLLIAWTGNMIAAVSALVFVPRLRRLGITTVSEMLEERFGLWLRLLPAVLWFFYYALFAGNAMYTFAKSLEPVVKLDVTLIIWIVGGGVVLYCFTSGLLAVVYTDVVQAFLIIFGGLILLPLSLKAVGGVSGLVRRVDPSYFVFWKAGQVWPTYKDVIMFTLLGLPYWCTSQYMLQRSFAGRTARDASKGLALAAILTFPLTLSYILPGICGSVIYAGDGALAEADSVLPRLFVDVLPIGLGGLFIAALVAASNSTASSLLNSLATLGEHDVFRRFVPRRSPRLYTWVGRMLTLVGGAMGLAFAFNVERLGGIIQANYQIMSFFEPPIFVVVAAALFWPRANAWGAGSAIAVGMTFSAVASGLKMPPADRTIVAFPVCLAALVIGTLAAEAVLGPSDKARRRVEGLLARMRPAGRVQVSAVGRAGLVLAGLCLVGFVGCAVLEDALPKPGNLFAFMGLGMGFVLGCYLAVPSLVPAEQRTAEAGAIEKSYVNRILGSGWTWLAVYVAAGAMVAALYLF